MPLNKVSNKEHKKTFKPWITKGILISIKRRNKLFNRYIKCTNVNKKMELFKSYKILRNLLVDLLKQSKRNFYRNYFSCNN